MSYTFVVLAVDMHSAWVHLVDLDDRLELLAFEHLTMAYVYLDNRFDYVFFFDRNFKRFNYHFDQDPYVVVVHSEK